MQHVQACAISSVGWGHFKVFKILNFGFYKVEKISKGSLDSIPLPSPSVKIQIIGGKVCLRYKGKTLLDKQTFEDKKLVDIAQQCFAVIPQVNFPTNNLNFH